MHNRAFLIGVLACSIVAIAQPGAPETKAGAGSRLAMTTDRIVVFKDGYGLVVKTATATADAQGRVYTDEVPDTAVLGSFWATAEDRTIRAMRAEWVTTRAERSTQTPCLNIPELLRANVGRTITLDVSLPGSAPGLTVYTGTLRQLLEMPAQPVGRPTEDQVDSQRPGGSPAPVRGETAVEVGVRGGQYLVLDTTSPKADRLVLPVDAVRAVSGDGLKTDMSRLELVTTTQKQLWFDLEPAAAGQSVRLSILYFTPGIRWIPTYRVAGKVGAGQGGGNGELKDAAQVSLQGEILNELEDIDGAAVDLVVGVPNFRFRSLPSPMTLEGTLRNALYAAAPALMGVGGGGGRMQQQQFSNALFSQRAGEWRQSEMGGLAGGPEGVDFAPELAATGEQDLFVYSAPKMLLRKGSRATLPPWSSSVPIKHLYTMDVNVVRNPRGDSGGGDYYAYDAKSATLFGRPPLPAATAPASPLQLAQQAVWHQLELTNTSDVPWTTGPAMILRGVVPLGQELLTYTSAKGKSLLPVTVAMDVRGTYTEEELERTPNALRWNNSNYALIRKRATVTITNSRKEASDTRLTVSLGGKAEKPRDGGAEGGVIKINDGRSDDWGDRNNYSYYLPNNHSDVTWSGTLQPGESRTYTVEFVFYVP